MLPSACKLPRYDYGSEGILHYYLRPCQKVLAYEPLRKEFAQVCGRASGRGGGWLYVVARSF